MQKPNISQMLGTVIKLNDPATSELVKPTAVKVPGEEKTDEEIEAEAEEQAGFKPPVETEQNTQVPEAEKVTEKPKISASIIKKSAESTAIAIDTGINLALPFLYKLRTFTGVERRIIRKHQQIFKARFRAEQKGKAVEFDLFKENDELENLYQDWCDFNEFVNDLAVDDEKLEAISAAWARVYEYYQKEPGPWGQLIMAYGAAYGQNVTPLFGF